MPKKCIRCGSIKIEEVAPHSWCCWDCYFMWDDKDESQAFREVKYFNG